VKWKLFALANTLALAALLVSPFRGYAEQPPFPPDGIDHLMYASSSLQKGMDDIEALLGVRPVKGGHHPGYGTHNALLSLGPGVYLEVIARDPELPAPEGGTLVDMPEGAQSRLWTWIYRTADIEAATEVAKRAGVGLGPVETGSRNRPDGSEISWQLTDPAAMPMDGAIPFLINWGSTTHPSLAVPSGGRLTELVIEHPQPDKVRSALASFGAKVVVRSGDQFRLLATIETDGGPVVLE
jgi:hypothetical protein